MTRVLNLASSGSSPDGLKHVPQIRQFGSYSFPMPHSLRLSLLAGRFAICRLASDAAIPAWALAGAFFSITRTADELSLVVEEAAAPASVRCEGGWRALKLAGPFPFTMTGVLASVLDPLAAAAISIFAVSTFDTDYVLVRHEALDHALAALRAAGHQVTSPESPHVP